MVRRVSCPCQDGSPQHGIQCPLGKAEAALGRVPRVQISAPAAKGFYLFFKLKTFIFTPF